ncbi:MAG TPA: hypothetical protein VEW48_04465, partial [Thermoanaerobaculia bacterium]|nr:hypothetical protein [Thermoanaerobaculia bacterium]
MRTKSWPKLAVTALAVTGVALAWRAQANHGTLPNRIPEPAPYDVAEAQFYPPPFEGAWEGANNPGVCDSCHGRIFNEWNGSMMSNAWRDPG